MAAHRRLRRREFLLNLLGRLRVPRVIMDRENPLEYLGEEEVFRRYRFRPQSILHLLGLLPEQDRQTNRGLPLPPLLQLLVFLRFVATGAVHLIVGESQRISRSTAGRTIRNMASCVSQLLGQYVQFPVGPEADRVKHGFFNIAGMFLCLLSIQLLK